MNRLFSLLCVAGLVGLAGSAYGAASLPYATGFEGAFSPTADPWSKGPSGAVGTDTVLPKAGTQTLVVSNSSATLTVGSGLTNVWYQVWAKPVAGTNDPTVSATGAFYVTTGGVLRAYTGSWTTITNGLPAGGGTWLGFCVHADYTAQKWDIYYTQAGSSMVKVGSNLPFNGSPTEMASVSIESGDAAAVDQVAVSRAYQSVSVSSPDRVVPYEFAASMQTNNFVLPVYSDTYIGSSNLFGVLGNDLRAALVTGDNISAYTASGWQTYTKQGTGLWDFDEMIAATTQLELHRVGASATFGFFAYNTSGYLAIGGQDNPSVSSSYSITLNPSGSPTYGFTSIVWPKSIGLNDHTPTTGFPLYNPGAALQVADRLYKQEPGQPEPLEYTWNNGANAWYRGGAAANATFPAGTRFWLKRGSGSTAAVSGNL